MTTASHTIVKNGMPFIGKVLRQVAPYMDKMFITVSSQADAGTWDELNRFVADHPRKLLEFFVENVASPGELTKIRQMQVDRTRQDWILFLDDDDYWPREELEECLKVLPKDDEVLAYSVSPYQLIDDETYDVDFSKKSFSKFLRNADGLHYEGAWPKDLPCDASGAPLYWKTHPKVRTLPYRFYHLAYRKSHSFRQEDWAKKFAYRVGRIAKLPEPFAYDDSIQ